MATTKLLAVEKNSLRISVTRAGSNQPLVRELTNSSKLINSTGIPCDFSH